MATEAAIVSWYMCPLKPPAEATVRRSLIDYAPPGMFYCPHAILWQVKRGQEPLEMPGEHGHHVLEAILLQQDIERLCQQGGMIERQRKFNLGMLVRVIVISTGTPSGGCQADILRSYPAFEVTRGARLPFYRWFDDPFEPNMAALAQQPPQYARAQRGNLADPLGGVRACYIDDSTTGIVRDALPADAPESGSDAALTEDKVRSAG